MWVSDITAAERHQHHLREAEQRRLARAVTGDRPNIFVQTWNAWKSRRAAAPVEQPERYELPSIYTTQEIRSLLS